MKLLLLALLAVQLLASKADDARVAAAETRAQAAEARAAKALADKVALNARLDALLKQGKAGAAQRDKAAADSDEHANIIAETKAAVSNTKTVVDDTKAKVDETKVAVEETKRTATDLQYPVWAAVIVALAGVLKSYYNGRKTDQIHVAINSRMTDLLRIKDDMIALVQKSADDKAEALAKKPASEQM